jgi:hypothetical protein
MLASRTISATARGLAALSRGGPRRRPRLRAARADPVPGGAAPGHQAARQGDPRPLRQLRRSPERSRGAVARGAGAWRGGGCRDQARARRGAQDGIAQFTRNSCSYEIWVTHFGLHLHGSSSVSWGVPRFNAGGSAALVTWRIRRSSMTLDGSERGPLTGTSRKAADVGLGRRASMTLDARERAP